MDSSVLGVVFVVAILVVVVIAVVALVAVVRGGILLVRRSAARPEATTAVASDQPREQPR